MRVRLLSPMITKELKFLAPRALILDCIIFLILLPFYKLCAEIPLGLAAGTLVMLLNFIILGLSSERAVERTIASAKRYMFASYLIRLAITGCLFVLCIKTPYLNIVTAAIPQLYPKICYTLNAAVQARKEGKD
ncbi:MAG: ATP synthase subunit I [Oscillospiraceae bacterium]|nr:ATP synthase subunit I [Oscillospiraceae bacterium]